MNKKVRSFISRNQKKLYILFSTSVLMMTPILAFAGDNEWGKNLADWIKTQASALALAAIVIIMVPLIVKKMWAAMIGTLVGGAVALYFVNNPDQLTTIGGAIKKIIFGS